MIPLEPMVPRSCLLLARGTVQGYGDELKKRRRKMLQKKDLGINSVPVGSEDKYHVKQIIKFGDYNVGRDGQLLTLPNYMQFLLDLEPEEIVLEPINVDAVNTLAKII